jgi:hypothetical protein
VLLNLRLQLILARAVENVVCVSFCPGCGPVLGKLGLCERDYDVKGWSRASFLSIRSWHEIVLVPVS